MENSDEDSEHFTMNGSVRPAWRIDINGRRVLEQFYGYISGIISVIYEKDIVSVFLPFLPVNN
jgi:hypothetical protein